MSAHMPRKPRCKPISLDEKGSVVIESNHTSAKLSIHLFLLVPITDTLGGKR